MNWSFSQLSGGALVAALAATSMMTLALYFLRLKRRPVSVPFVDLFRELLLEKKATAWRTQLRRWLSLLLALLLVSALVLAFAGPVRTVEQRGRRVVVLVDAGVHMSAEQLTQARRLIEPWFSTLGAEDRMMLVEVGARPRGLNQFTSDRAILERGLEQLEARDVPARFLPAWQLARSALEEPSENEQAADASHSQEVIWVSPSAPPPGLELDDVELSHQPIEHATLDSDLQLAITRFSARRVPRDPSRFEVLVTLQNASARIVPVELSIFSVDRSGRRAHAVEVRQLDLAPSDESGPERIVLHDLSSAEWGLEAELRAVEGTEGWLRDNLARTTLAENPPLDVLVVGELDTFLEAALLLDDSLKVSTVSASSYPPAGRFDLTFFNGVYPKRSSTTGAAIYFGPPGDDDGSPVDRGEPLQLFGFDTWEEDSPIFEGIDPYDVQVLDGVSLRPASGPDGTPDRSLGASAGLPILVRGHREEGPFIVMGFAPTRSDFVLRPAWPLFLLNLIDAVTVRPRDQVTRSFVTGETWRISVADAEARSAEVAGPFVGRSEAPPSRSVPVIDGQAVLFGDQVGFYEVRTSSGKRRFAANLPPESLHASVPEQAPTPEQAAEPAAESTSYSVVTPRPTRARSEPWFWLVLGVFVAACLEWWSFHRRWTV